MKIQKHSIYILGNKPLKLGALRRFLLDRFKNRVTIFIYFNTKNFLRVMHSGVDLVILDHLNGKGNNPEQVAEVLKSIKARFPETDVIINTSNDDVAIVVEAMSTGASGYFVEHNSSWLKIGMLADRIIAQPLRVLVAEWGVVKFLGIFLLTFVIMAIVVAIALNALPFV